MKFWLQFVMLPVLASCSEPHTPLTSPLSTPPEGLNNLKGPALQLVQKHWEQVKSSPNSPQSWRELTFATHANDLLKAALQAHQVLAGLESTVADSFRMAVVLERLGERPEALALLQELEDPTGTASRRAAKILLGDGQLEAALQAANDARAFDSQNLGHLTVWCEIQLQRNEPRAVRKALNEALSSVLPPSWLHTLDTRAAEILGDAPPPYASTPADRVLYLPNVHLDPLLPWVRTREGDVERLRATIKSGNKKDALTLSGSLVADRPDDAELAAVYAGLLREAGRNREALQILDQHRAKLPADAVFWKNDAMSRLFAFTEGGPDAQIALDMARESADRATKYGAGDLQCWKVSGIVAGQEQNHARAERDYRKAAQLAQGSTKILLTLDAEMSHGRTGDWSSTVEALLPLERQYGMSLENPLSNSVRRATIEALARAGFVKDAKERIAALARVGRSEATALSKLVEEIEAERSRFPSPSF